LSAYSKYNEENFQKLPSANYHTPADLINVVFKNNDTISFFLMYVFEESILLSKKIKEDGDEIFYPLLYNTSINQFSIDYQYFIHLLAKFVYKRTDDKASYKKVFTHFGIFQRTIKSSISIRNRAMLIYFLDYINGVIDHRTYFKEVRNTQNFLPRIVQFKGQHIETKSILFRKLGLNKYFDYYKFYSDQVDFLVQPDVKEIVWGSKLCKKVWLKEDIPKRNYIMFSEYDSNRIITDDELIFRLKLDLS